MVTKTRFRIKPKPPVRKPSPRSNQVLLLVDTGKKHSTTKGKQKLVGPATVDVFKKTVATAFNRASVTGNGQALYLAKLKLGGKIEVVAKLFQVKRNEARVNNKGKIIYTMFSTFHAPDGVNWKRRAKVSNLFEKRTRQEPYPSRENN